MQGKTLLGGAAIAAAVAFAGQSAEAAPITFDNPASVNNKTLNYDVTDTGENRVLVAIGAIRGTDADPVGMSYVVDGTSYPMLQAVRHKQAETTYRAAATLYYLVNPPTGAGQIIWDQSGTDGDQIFAMTLYNVDQTAPLGQTASDGANGNSTNTTQEPIGVPLTLTGLSAGSLIVSAMEMNYFQGGTIVPTNATAVSGSPFVDGISAGLGVGTTVVDESAETVTWTWSSSWNSRTAVVAAEFVAVPEPGTLAFVCVGALGLLRRRRLA